jgi:hypothetical protein
MQNSPKFSPFGIDQLPGGRHPDPIVPGLCVIVCRLAGKSRQYRRRVARSGTIVTLKLGAFPAYSISDARQWAGGLNLAIERGEDPRIAMRIEKVRAMSVADAHALYIAALKRGDRKTLAALTEIASIVARWSCCC